MRCGCACPDLYQTPEGSHQLQGAGAFCFLTSFPCVFQMSYSAYLPPSSKEIKAIKNPSTGNALRKRVAAGASPRDASSSCRTLGLGSGGDPAPVRLPRVTHPGPVGRRHSLQVVSSQKCKKTLDTTDVRPHSNLARQQKVTQEADLPPQSKNLSI